MKYLIAAYAVIFVVVLVYLLNIDAKERAVLREIFALKKPSGK
jgi:CcmD family protein